MNSIECFERSLKVTPGGVHSPVRAFRSVGGDPIFFASAQGAYLTDVEGKKYLDFCLSFGPLILGHRDPEVQKTVEKMVNTAWSFGACEPYSLALAEWVTSRIPFIQKIRFTTSGTEAVMTALRLARAHTKREKILKLNGCYHGHVDSMLVKSGSGLAGTASSDSAGVSETTASDTLVCDLDDLAGFKTILKTHAKEIAAVIVEPLPANYGLLIQREEFLREVARLTKEIGALLIFDEVISGFRVGMQGMAGALGIEPDLVTYGKVVGGGFPVGAYGGKTAVMDQVAPMGAVYQAGTLSANPICMAAGLRTLQRMEELKIFDELEVRGKAWEKKLQDSWNKSDLPFQISRVGSLFWIHPRVEETIRSIATIPQNHKKIFSIFFHELCKRGIYLAPSGFEVGFLSYAHTPEILDASVQHFHEAAMEAQRKAK